MQTQFKQDLQRFATYLNRRVKEIQGRFEAFCHQEPAKKQIYENYWKKRLHNLQRDTEKLKRTADLRPSLCVMGKRGQGKTSLLQSWLGKKTAQGGIEEMAYFPTGEADTTACLIRLTQARDTLDLSPHYLHVEMFSPNIEPDLRKPAPPLNLMGKEVRLVRHVRDEDGQIGLSDPYRVCRFPVMNKDDNFRFEEQGEHYIMGLNGHISLPELQWHAKHVRVPVVYHSQTAGLAGQILDVLDVIDAPGADSMEGGGYPEWKRAKNAQVFITATHELDVLLVVSSANVDAMNIGGQFMDNVWTPWLARCQGQGLGRVLLSITHAAYPIKKAWDLLGCEDWQRERIKNPDAPQPEGCHHSLSESNFRYKVVQNVLEPLMYGGDHTPIMNQTDLNTWPPMFFFEGKRSELEGFELAANSAEATATKLIHLLDKKGEKACEDEQLPRGERCVLRLVQDWGDLAAPEAQRKAVQHWLIRALTAVLDPADCGFRLFTETVVKYATIGPIASNHCQERLQMVDAVWQDFKDLLNEFGQPDNHVSALSELQQTQAFLKSIWFNSDLRGKRLQLGAACKRRLDLIEENANPTTVEKKTFSFEDIVNDIANDTVAQLSELSKQSPTLRDQLKRSLGESLKHDYPLQELAKRYENLFQRQKDSLLRIQSVAIERVVRVMDYIVKADESDLRKIAVHCYEENLDMSALLQFVLQSGVGLLSADDENQYQSVQHSGSKLTSEITAADFQAPYNA